MIFSREARPDRIKFHSTSKDSQPTMNNDLDEILAFLEYIRSQNRLVSIVNTYKGVSYSLSVNLLRVSPQEGTITISTLQRQYMSLLPNIQVNIHCDLFPFIVRARVAAVDNAHRSAVLHAFSYERSIDENRSHMRFEPRQTINVRVHIEKGAQLEGIVHDISIEGISILLKDLNATDQESLQAGISTRLLLAIPLNPNDTPHMFNIPGKVMYANPIEGEQTRLGLQIYPVMAEQALLRRYIFDRQTEIFQTINPLARGD
jgi:hypothetical protein